MREAALPWPLGNGGQGWLWRAGRGLAPSRREAKPEYSSLLPAVVLEMLTRRLAQAPPTSLASPAPPTSPILKLGKSGRREFSLDKRIIL